MQRLNHGTGERNTERLGPIIDLPGPRLLAEAGLDVWQAYGLHWLLCELVGFVVRCSSDGVEDDAKERVTDLTYSMRRWAHELHADETAVAEGFRVLHALGIIRIADDDDGRVTIGVPHLDAYADRIWSPKRTKQQRERRAQKRDSESTRSQHGADSPRKTDRQTRGKSVSQTSGNAVASSDAPPSGPPAGGGGPSAASPALPEVRSEIDGLRRRLAHVGFAGFTDDLATLVRLRYLEHTLIAPLGKLPATIVPNGDIRLGWQPGIWDFRVQVVVDGYDSLDEYDHERIHELGYVARPPSDENPAGQIVPRGTVTDAPEVLSEAAG